MDNIKDIFKRLDLQCIRDFLLTGGDNPEVSEETYAQRLEKPKTLVFGMIERRFPEKEIDEVVEPIHHYAETTQNVYMEIGMICGGTLMSQLLNRGGASVES